MKPESPPLSDAEIELLVAEHFADGHVHDEDGFCPLPVYATNKLQGKRGVLSEDKCPECGQPQLELWSGVCCSVCRWWYCA